MTFQPDAWERFVFDETPIYVRPGNGDWFVPNHAGDELLRTLPLGQAGSRDVMASRFLDRLPPGDAAPFAGRSEVLELKALSELWLHITDRCDLACSHCMFSCTPAKASRMSLEDVQTLGRQAVDLGCRVFALTGGEPLIHPDFERIVDTLLGFDGSHVAVLTNLMTLEKHLDSLRRWPEDRFHLQISVDGLEENHDRFRGRGTFHRLRSSLELLRSLGHPVTLSMAVMKDNVADMADVVDLAADVGAGQNNVHFLWYFVRGRGKDTGFVSPREILDNLTEAASRAEARRVGIDNIDALRDRVFAPSGTIFDGTNAAWESLAVAPDSRLTPGPPASVALRPRNLKVYPTPATIGLEALGVPF
ncbi:MAG: radical SAM protein, partial [Proteobacteria bacterium]|nr:radical SAM protein [Pseudomonadota bacterium]